MEVMHEDADDPIKFGKGIKWSGKKIKAFRVDERKVLFLLYKYVHKCCILCAIILYVLGTNPYQKCVTLQLGSLQGTSFGL